MLKKRFGSLKLVFYGIKLGYFSSISNNLNNIHFSTNLGIGLKYSFMKSFEFNLEPTVKYQLNTYSSDSGDFKPYFLGVYSGVSYKF